jgi:hypothetical protein
MTRRREALGRDSANATDTLSAAVARPSAPRLAGSAPVLAHSTTLSAWAPKPYKGAP